MEYHQFCGNGVAVKLLVPMIVASVEALSTAEEVWSTLSNLYSGKGNVMLMAQIEDKVHDLKQGEKPLMEYICG